MSHVDDGELTAYADGAYPVDDPVALRISAHLSTCDNCRTRLEQSQELRARAAEILSYAAPVSLQAPSFESLQAQVRRPRTVVPRAVPLAWAATIVLALGLGWFGRGALQSGRNESMLAERDATVSTDEARPTAAPAPELQQAAPPAARVQPPAAASRAPQLAAADQLRSEAANRAAGDAAVGAAAGTVAAAPAAPPPTAPPLAELDLSEAREEALKVEAGRATASSGEFISAAEAERRGLVIPRIPELPITRIALQAGSRTVEQSLPDGKLIRLVVTQEVAAAEAQKAQRSAAAPPAAPARAMVGDAALSVTVQVRGYTVTVTGSVPPDSLRALAGKVR